MKCKTVFKRDVIDSNVATNLYNLLKHNIVWEDGVKSKLGFTRKAKPMYYGQMEEIDDVIDIALMSLTDTQYEVEEIYLNYYRDGSDFCPNHTHKGTHQIVISLGETRTLKVGTKNYDMGSGSAIIFGSSSHGVVKDNSVNGRISIATFLTKRAKEGELIQEFQNFRLG